MPAAPLHLNDATTAADAAFRGWHIDFIAVPVHSCIPVVMHNCKVECQMNPGRTGISAGTPLRPSWSVFAMTSLYDK